MATSVAKRTADGVFIKEFKIKESKKLFSGRKCTHRGAIGPLDTKHCESCALSTFPGRKEKIRNPVCDQTCHFLIVSCCKFVTIIDFMTINGIK